MNPYPGLRPFAEEDSPHFRGRDAEIEQLLNLLAVQRFVLVTGTSGSGKSSLVQAGVIPILRSGLAIDLAAEWTIVVVRPSRGPLEQMRELLGAPEIFTKPSDLLSFARRKLAGAGRLLVVVDQFEEIFDYRRDKQPVDGGNECALFVNLLLAATDQRDTPVSVLLTMRSDYLGECSQFRGLAEALNRGHYLVPRLTRLQQEEAIIGPAASLGVEFEPRLVQRLLNDSEDNADRLPVLQHILKRLWEQKRARSIIADSDYREIGGWDGALEQDAGGVLDRFSKKERTGVARLFQWITVTNAAGQPVRRPRPLGELPAATGMERTRLAEVIRVFAARDLLQTGGDAADDSAPIDLTHESVIWNWPWLQQVTNEEAAVSTQANFLKLSQAKKARLTGVTLRQAGQLLRQMEERPQWARRHLTETEQRDISSWLRRTRRRQWVDRITAAMSILVVSAAVVYQPYMAYRQKLAARQQAAQSTAAVSAVQGLIQTLPPNLKPKVVLDYAGEFQSARALGVSLSKFGYSIEYNNVPDRNIPDVQVNYFRADDKTGAEALAGQLSTLIGGNVRVNLVAADSIHAQPGQLEVWLPKSAVPAPLPPSVAVAPPKPVFAPSERPSKPSPPAQSKKVHHLVVLMLENRSFDHMLGGLKSQDPRIDGLTGGESNPDLGGQPVKVAPLADYQGQLQPDPRSNFAAVDLQIFNGVPGEQPNMLGFVRSYAQSSNLKHARAVMNYFAPDKLPVLTTLARKFAVCNRWFASVPASSVPNWAFANMATSMGRLSGIPNWAGGPDTIFERLLKFGVTSKIYYHDFTPALTVPKLVQHISPFSQFLADCQTGNLPAYSYITPRYSDAVTAAGAELANDQHPDHNVLAGERLIATVYNAISANRDVWGGTILVIVYSNHGGLYDHVAPTTTVSPDGYLASGQDESKEAAPPFDFKRLGVRVPAVIVSPFIEAGAVDDTVYDHTSLIATARKLFLGAAWADSFLTERDRQANTFDRLLTRSSPRTDYFSFDLQ